MNFDDVRGIGRVDCLFSIYSTSANQVKLSILPCEGSVAAPAPADFITGYTGGLGATLALLYAPLTDSMVYADFRSAYPYVNMLSGSASSHMLVGRFVECPRRHSVKRDGWFPYTADPVP